MLFSSFCYPGVTPRDLLTSPLRLADADGQADGSRPPGRATARWGRLELFDKDVPGFCIRITPNGRRTAFVFYRVGSRLRRATLGELPQVRASEAARNRDATTDGIQRATEHSAHKGLGTAQAQAPH